MRSSITNMQRMSAFCIQSPQAFLDGTQTFIQSGFSIHSRVASNAERVLNLSTTPNHRCNSLPVSACRFESFTLQLRFLRYGQCRLASCGCRGACLWVCSA